MVNPRCATIGYRRSPNGASEVYFADTYDKIGPLGAKAQGECAINAVAPAIANAVANATGVRFPDLPLTPDRIFDKLTPTAPRGGTEFK